MKISLESDGTKAGTKLTVNGAQVDFESTHFGADQFARDVWFAYTTVAKDKDQKIVTRTTYSYDPSLASMAKKTEKPSVDDIDMADFGKM